MAADSGTYDDMTKLRRYRIAEAMIGDPKKPVQHWAEGLSEIGKGLLGGYQISKEDERQRADEAKSTADLYKMAGLAAPASAAVEPSGGFQKLAALMSGGGQSAPPMAPMGDAPVSPPPITSAPMPPVSQPQIVGPNEPSPLDTAQWPAGPIGAPGSPKAPRGIRNNNPLNIEAGDFTKGQPGFTGSDGRFARFETPEQGVAAANKLLDTYERKYGLNTPAGIINRWAPQGENNSTAYAGRVAKELGIGVNDPISPEMRPKLISAMSLVENGQAAPGVDAIARAMRPVDQPYQVAGPATAAPSGGAPAIAEAMSPQAGGIFAGVPKDKLPALLSGLTSKNPTMKALAVQQLGNYTKSEAPTDETKEYSLAQRQGYKGSFMDFKTELKKAGATNVTTNVGKDEEAFDKEAGKIVAQRFNELAAEGPTAKQMVSDVQTLQQLGTQIGTGKGAQVKGALGPYAEALGIKIDGLSDIQAYEAIVNRVAPTLRVKGSGAQSDMELKNFLKSLPSLGNTPEGNALIAKTMEGLAQNKVRAAEIGSMALNKEISRKEAEKMLRELPDPMAEWRESQKAAKPAAGSAEQGWKDLGGGIRIREKK